MQLIPQKGNHSKQAEHTVECSVDNRGVRVDHFSYPTRTRSR